jgi:hypothetical protein
LSYEFSKFANKDEALGMPFLTEQPQNRRCPPQIDPAACCRRTNANRFCSMLLKNLRRD